MEQIENSDKRISLEKLLEYQMTENAYHINKYSQEDYVLAYCLCELSEDAKGNVINDNRKLFSRKVIDRAKSVLRYYNYLYGSDEYDNNMLSHLYKIIRDYQKHVNTDERLFFIVIEDDDGELRLIKDPWTAVKYTSDIGKFTRKRFGFATKLLADAKLKYYQDRRDELHFTYDPYSFKVVKLSNMEKSEYKK